MEPVQGKHSIAIKDRRDMRIDGVTEVISFDDLTVMLKTQCGNMSIEGKDLKIAVLEIDAGIVVLSGTVSGVYYYDPKNSEKRSLFAKLIK